MRLLERRYFTKLDDKKTGSIDSIMAFLKTTHHELMAHIQSLENAKQHLARWFIRFSSSSSFPCILIMTSFSKNTSYHFRWTRKSNSLDAGCNVICRAVYRV